METPPPVVVPSQNRPPVKSGYLAWAAALAVLVSKGGWTFFSMFLTIWTYSLFFGWGYAIGVVVLIFVHEMGHVVAAKLLGLPVTAPLFIPFVGAAIFMKENPRDAWTEALVAYGGPLAGTLGGWVCLLAGVVDHSRLLVAVSSATFVLNLFNLIPIPPLDGGRICAAVSRWFWVLGILLMGAAVVYFQAWNMIFIVVLVLISAFQRVMQMWRTHASEATRFYYRISWGGRALAAVAYLGLVALLLFGCWASNPYLQYITQEDF